jgi:hypothetical protein
MMISSEGTQFGLDFLVVQVHDWYFHPAQFIGEPQPVHADEFRRLSERKLAKFKEADGQLECQFFFHRLTWLAAGDQEVVGISDGQFSHAPTLVQSGMTKQDFARLLGGGLIGHSNNRSP